MYDKYYNYSYVFVENQIFNVCDKFPKIIQENYNSGIHRVTYNINLIDCKDFKIDPDEWKIQMISDKEYYEQFMSDILTSASGEEDPIKALKLRFAKGEITKEEFLEMKSMLE